MTLLSRHPTARVEPEPFPHLVIEDAFPDALYRQLCDEFPSLERFTQGRSLADSHKVYRIATDLLADPQLSGTWRRTIEEHAGPAHFLATYRLFRPHLLAAYPDFEARFGVPEAMRTGLKGGDDFRGHDLLLDAILTIHAPNRKAAATDRGPHVKVSDKPILGHLMFPHPDDTDECGGLELYAWTAQQPPRVGHHNVLIDGAAMQPVKVIPYRANTLVVFLNTPRSVQAWQPRGRSEHPLRYMHFYCQVSEPLFDLPRTQVARLRTNARRWVDRLLPANGAGGDKNGQSSVS